MKHESYFIYMQSLFLLRQAWSTDSAWTVVPWGSLRHGLEMSSPVLCSRTSLPQKMTLYLLTVVFTTAIPMDEQTRITGHLWQNSSRKNLAPNMNNCDKVCFQFLSLAWRQRKSLCRPDNVAKSQSARSLKRAIQQITTTRRLQDLPNAKKKNVYFLRKIPTKLSILDSWRVWAFTFLHVFI